MNRGLLAKAWRETWPIVLCCTLGVMLIEVVEAYTLLKFQRQVFKITSHLPFVQQLIRSFLGTAAADQISPEMLPAIAWAHPIALAIIWGHAIAYCTRMPAGEVDRGTIDVLLGLPVSRRELYISETAMWLSSAVIVLLAWVGGNVLGTTLAEGVSIPTERLVALGVNLFCLYVAVGGLAWLVSALSDRRGRAVVVVLAFVLFAFLLNYLAPFWEFAQQLSFLSILHYYVPLTVFRDGSWPLPDMAILLAIAAFFWTCGALVFSRRDLSTL